MSATGLMASKSGWNRIFGFTEGGKETKSTKLFDTATEVAT